MFFARIDPQGNPSLLIILFPRAFSSMRAFSSFFHRSHVNAAMFIFFLRSPNPLTSCLFIHEFIHNQHPLHLSILFFQMQQRKKLSIMVKGVWISYSRNQDSWPGIQDLFIKYQALLRKYQGMCPKNQNSHADFQNLQPANP